MSESKVDVNGALEAVDRILNRGGGARDVLEAVLEALRERGVAHAAIRFVEGGEIVAGPATEAVQVPVRHEGRLVGELELAAGDRAFAERIATLISAYVAAAGRARP